jgi:heme oxygenase
MMTGCDDSASNAGEGIASADGYWRFLKLMDWSRREYDLAIQSGEQVLGLAPLNRILISALERDLACFEAVSTSMSGDAQRAANGPRPILPQAADNTPSLQQALGVTYVFKAGFQPQSAHYLQRIGQGRGARWRAFIDMLDEAEVEAQPVLHAAQACFARLADYARVLSTPQVQPIFAGQNAGLAAAQQTMIEGVAQ